MKRFTIVAVLVLTFAASATAATSTFVGWTTAKAESTLVAKLHASPSSAEIARIQRELHLAIQEAS
jgi:hypothetical protein